MSPFTTALLICNMLAMTNAQSSVLQLFLGDLGAGQSLHGSVVGVTSGTTSYDLQCVSSATGNECLFPTTKFPAIQGPSTAAYTLGLSNSFGSVITEACSLQGTTLAICTGAGNLDLPSSDTYILQTTESQPGTVLISPYATVTITGGLDLLSSSTVAAGPTITAPGAAPTTSSTSSTSTSTSSTSTSSISTSSASTTSTGSSTTSSTISATNNNSTVSLYSKNSAPTAAAQAGSGIIAMAALGLYYAL